jgi:hypothetical protein
MLELIATSKNDIALHVILGLNHEQQHQELLLMDIKAILAANPLKPRYHELCPPPSIRKGPCEWLAYAGGMQLAGTNGPVFISIMRARDTAFMYGLSNSRRGW